jgi:prophage antirepressor-like protein
MTGLSKILIENDVHVSTKNGISLNDFVEQIIKSKNPENYMKSVKDKSMYKKKYYITEETCMELLAKGKSKKCKEIYTEIQEEGEDEDNTSIISVKDNIFQYGGTKFTSFFVVDKNGERNVWLKARKVAEYLEYKRPADAIRDHVEEENKLSYGKLLEFYGVDEISTPKKLDKQTIFINISGFFNLIHGSKQKLAKQIKTWIDKEVLPALMNHGSYSIQPEKIDVPCVYDGVAISDYDDKAVVYIGEIGMVNGETLYKYGLSRDMFKRDYEQHSKNFKMFKVILLEETDHCKKVEDLFKQNMKTLTLNRKYKNNTEIFTVSIKYPITSLLSLMKKLVKENPLPALKKANEKIEQLKNNNELVKIQLETSIIIEKEKTKQIESQAIIERERAFVEKEKEKTKQIELQTKQMELQIKMIELQNIPSKSPQNVSSKSPQNISDKTISPKSSSTKISTDAILSKDIPKVVPEQTNNIPTIDTNYVPPEIDNFIRDCLIITGDKSDTIRIPDINRLLSGYNDKWCRGNDKLRKYFALRKIRASTSAGHDIFSGIVFRSQNDLEKVLPEKTMELFRTQIVNRKRPIKKRKNK